MKTLIGDRDFFAGLAADLALHHDETARRRVLPVPDRRVLTVASPRRIEIRVRAVAQLVKPGAVHVDDEDRRLPLEHIGIVLEPAEADQHVAGLRPGRLEVPVARRHGLSLGLADLVDMDFAVAVVRNPRGPRRAGLAGAGQQRRERRADPGGGRDRYGCLRGPGQELASAQLSVVWFHCVLSPVKSSESAAVTCRILLAPCGLSVTFLYPFVSDRIAVSHRRPRGPNPAAAQRAGRGLDAAAVPGDDPLDKGQTQPHSTFRRAVRKPHKGFEDAFPVGFRDSFSVVVDVEDRSPRHGHVGRLSPAEIRPASCNSLPATAWSSVPPMRSAMRCLICAP